MTTDSTTTEQNSLPNLPEVQREILRRLSLASSSRYSQLRDRYVEGNLHTYHLNELRKQGWLEKCDMGYRLTTQGRWLAGLINSQTGQFQLQPKLCVMLYAKNEAGEVLSFTWKRQPFFDQVSLPYGKLHVGHSTIEAAQDELFEKTGISGELSYLGCVSVRATVDGETLNHFHAHVFEVTSLTGEIASAKTGAASFINPDTADKQNWSPGFSEILAWCEDKKRPQLLEVAVEA